MSEVDGGGLAGEVGSDPLSIGMALAEGLDSSDGLYRHLALVSCSTR